MSSQSLPRITYLDSDYTPSHASRQNRVETGISFWGVASEKCENKDNEQDSIEEDEREAAPPLPMLTGGRLYDGELHLANYRAAASDSAESSSGTILKANRKRLNRSFKTSTSRTIVRSTFLFFLLAIIGVGLFFVSSLLQNSDDKDEAGFDDNSTKDEEFEPIPNCLSGGDNVVFLLDESKNIGSDNYEILKDSIAFEAVTTMYSFDEKLTFGVIEFTGKEENEFKEAAIKSVIPPTTLTNEMIGLDLYHSILNLEYNGNDANEPENPCFACVFEYLQHIYFPGQFAKSGKTPARTHLILISNGTPPQHSAKEIGDLMKQMRKEFNYKLHMYQVASEEHSLNPEETFGDAWLETDISVVNRDYIHFSKTLVDFFTKC